MRTSHSLMAAAIAFVSTSSAWSATETIDLSSGLSPIVAGATLTLSDNTLSSFNIAAATLTAVPPFFNVGIVGYPGDYTSAQFPLSGTSLSYEGSTGEVLSLSTTFGYRVETNQVTGVSGGGWFEVNNLNIDFQHQRIEGTIQGQTDGGVSVSYAGVLFNLPSMTYNPIEWAQGQFNIQLSDMALSGDALNAMTSSLDAMALLKAGFAATASNYGSLNVWITDSTLDAPPFAFSPPTMATAVPEPSSWALLAAGLLGVALNTRRKLARSAR